MSLMHIILKHQQELMKLARENPVAYQKALLEYANEHIRKRLLEQGIDFGEDEP